MDPISISGLALGVVSLTFQIFSGCVTAYQIILDANDMPERYQFLWVRLQMEQYKLLDWADTANLSEQDVTLTAGLRLNRQTVNEVLYQIESLLQDLGGLSQRYKLRLLADDKASDSAKKAPAGRVQGRGDLMKNKALELMSKSRRYPSRLRWAVFDQQKFEALLADLTLLNNSLLYFLEGEQKRRVYELQQDSFMQILQLSNKMDDLFNLVSSLEVGGGNAAGKLTVQAEVGQPNIASADSTRNDLDQKLVRLAKFKALSVAVEQNVASPFVTRLQGSDSDSIEISISEIQGLERSESDPSATRSACVYEGVPVWVEWKHYLPQGLDFTPPPYVADRVRKLAIMLRNEQMPEEFRVPHCLGYIHQPELERYGYVFRWRAQNASHHSASTSGFQQSLSGSTPVSLEDLIRSSKVPPSLSVRVAMMRAIATSVWYLHATNWLHKGLRSENVLFPGTAEEKRSSAVLSTPFLSGFEYARPAEAGEQTERPAANLQHDLYRHPRAQFDLPRDGKRGFKKIYDVYSLGVVLLEIGLWEPVRTALDIAPDRAVTPRDVQRASTVLGQGKTYIDELRGLVGDTVAEVVVTCLTGDFGMKKDAAAEENDVVLQTAFGERVVKRLDNVLL